MWFLCLGGVKLSVLSVLYIAFT